MDDDSLVLLSEVHRYSQNDEVAHLWERVGRNVGQQVATQVPVNRTVHINTHPRVNLCDMNA